MTKLVKMEPKQTPPSSRKLEMVVVPTNRDNDNQRTQTQTQTQNQTRVVENVEENKTLDYSKRAQWLRAAVLGANDGLVSIASLMMGIGAVRKDIKVMILTGFAGLVAGACSMAIGEYVSVYSQLDIEVAQRKREATVEEEDEKLPNPLQAAGASALAFAVGAMVPLLAASFIRDFKVRLGVVAVAVTVALAVFGWLGAVLGGAPVVRASARVLVGGWVAMALTYGLTKLMASNGV